MGNPFADIDPDPSGESLLGRVYVLSGIDGSMLRSHEEPAGEFFGGGVSAVGDQTADGIEEYAIGDRGSGTLHLFDGAHGTRIRSIPIPASPDPTFPALGSFALARAGDRDGDGLEDLWVGVAPGGSVHLVATDGEVLGSVADPTPEPGARALASFGSRLAPIDMPGPGPIAALIVGNAAEVSGTGIGRASCRERVSLNV